MVSISPYIVFNGTCEAAFNFYKTVFGGAFKEFNKFKDFPQEPGKELPAEALEKIMHVSLPIGKNYMLYGSDGNPNENAIVVGENISISINVESKEEADVIFNGLAHNGKITMPIADTFWGAYFGMLTDQFGIMWLVNYDAV